ncbi:MAG TPA: large-conductance mechanosensitive channel protein MscL [Gemmatales bacterium]|nr:large-conductance mechanosensitive channel protein MscL [Gemmatales bacterium]
MGILREFKTFIQRGNVIDLAVGVIIGAAFGRIVSSLVADILMPPIGLLTGGINFTDLKLSLGGDPNDAAKMVTLNYGSFLQTVVDFLIVAGCVFALVKGVNSLKRADEAKPAEPSAEAKLLSEIRDLLKDQAASR